MNKILFIVLLLIAISGLFNTLGKSEKVNNVITFSIFACCIFFVLFIENPQKQIKSSTRKKVTMPLNVEEI